MGVASDMTGQSAARAGAAVGSSIFSVFGAGWLIVWSRKTMGNAPVLWVAVALVAMAFLPAFRESWERLGEQEPFFDLFRIRRGLADSLVAQDDG